MTDPIVPRWEWRTFGASFGAADAMLAGLTPTGVEESDELYLLSEDGDNVKVRAELMDIKVLRDVDRHGLQRWEPAFKATFPLTAADVAGRLRGASPAAPDARPGRVLAGGAPRRARRARRGGPARVRPQAAGPLRVRRVHGRADRHRCRRPPHPHARHRSRGPGRRLGHRDRPRARRPRQHERAAGVARPRRRRAPSVRGDRRRHELGEVPRRRADQRRGVAAGGRSGRDDQARRRAGRDRG